MQNAKPWMVWVWLWSFHYVQLLEHITDTMHKNRDQLKEKLITQHVPARYIPPAHNALLLWSRAENLKDGCDLWVISPPSQIFTDILFSSMTDGWSGQRTDATLSLVFHLNSFCFRPNWVDCIAMVLSNLHLWTWNQSGKRDSKHSNYPRGEVRIDKGAVI